MEKLSKIRVADDLKIYFELCKIARVNQTKSFKEIYTNICKNIRKDENHTDGYKEIGKNMEERYLVKSTYLGNSNCRLFSAKVAQESAIEYFNKN